MDNSFKKEESKYKKKRLLIWEVAGIEPVSSASLFDVAEPAAAVQPSSTGERGACTVKINTAYVH